MTEKGDRQTLWTKQQIQQITLDVIAHQREECQRCSHLRWDHGDLEYGPPVCDEFKEDESR